MHVLPASLANLMYWKYQIFENLSHLIDLCSATPNASETCTGVKKKHDFLFLQTFAIENYSHELLKTFTLKNVCKNNENYFRTAPIMREINHLERDVKSDLRIFNNRQIHHIFEKKKIKILKAT